MDKEEEGCRRVVFYFFFNDTATTEIYALSLHDALPICAAVRVAEPCREPGSSRFSRASGSSRCSRSARRDAGAATVARSEEHTSELQSRQYLVCRLLLEKKTLSTSPVIFFLSVPHYCAY